MHNAYVYNSHAARYVYYGCLKIDVNFIAVKETDGQVKRKLGKLFNASSISCSI